MAISPNILDRDKAAYKENTTDGGLDRRVTDVIAHDKLDAIVGALGGSVDTDVTIFNVSAPTANTEVSQALPAGTKRFILRARNRSQLQISYTSGQTGSLYMTIRPGAVFEDQNFYSTQTIYFQCSEPGETVEIIAYT